MYVLYSSLVRFVHACQGTAGLYLQQGLRESASVQACNQTGTARASRTCTVACRESSVMCCVFYTFCVTCRELPALCCGNKLPQVQADAAAGEISNMSHSTAGHTSQIAAVHSTACQTACVGFAVLLGTKHLVVIHTYKLWTAMLPLCYCMPCDH